MATDKPIVQKRSDGKTERRKPGAKKATAIVANQAKGIARACEILAHDGGGELQIREMKRPNSGAEHHRAWHRPKFVGGLNRQRITLSPTVAPRRVV